MRTALTSQPGWPALIKKQNMSSTQQSANLSSIASAGTKVLVILVHVLSLTYVPVNSSQLMRMERLRLNMRASNALNFLSPIHRVTRTWTLTQKSSNACSPKIYSYTVTTTQRTPAGLKSRLLNAMIGLTAKVMKKLEGSWTKNTSCSFTIIYALILRFMESRQSCPKLASHGIVSTCRQFKFHSKLPRQRLSFRTCTSIWMSSRS